MAVEIQRTPKKDDLLPLSKPVVGLSGKVYKDLPVPAGTVVTISTVGYNLYVLPLYLHHRGGSTRLVSPFRRNKDIWGPDAYEFRPERWLDMNGKPESPVGVYGNLCVVCFYARHMCREMRFLDSALPSPGVLGAALDGDSRKSHHITTNRKI